MSFRSKSNLMFNTLIFLGVVFMVVGILMYTTTERPNSWSTTPGTVTDSYVVDDGSSYYPVVKYRYQVSGVEYANHKIKYLEDAQVTDRSVAEAVAQKYPVGASVTVYYDPSDPGSSVLELGQGTFTFILIFVAATLLTIGVGGAVWTLVSRTEVQVGRGMGGGRQRWIDPTNGPSYNIDAHWVQAPMDSLNLDERVLWRGKPVKAPFLLSLGRTSMLGFILIAVVFAVLLTITGIAFSLDSLVWGSFVLLAIVLVATTFQAVRQAKRIAGTEYILTDQRVIIQDGGSQPGWRFIPLVQISQVLVAETLVDRIYGTGSLVVSDTMRADFICIKAPWDLKRMVKEAMVAIWERARASQPSSHS
jgi:hypothetical protein